MGDDTTIQRTQERLFELYKTEYITLKGEQGKRIGFRDNLLYVTLGAVGALCSYAMQGPTQYHAFLLVPWACFILGWTYLMNDQKISEIGRYVREELAGKLELLGIEESQLFGWEVAHRSDEGRYSRKLIQLTVDLGAFCVSSALALVAYLQLVANPSGFAYLLVAGGWVTTLIMVVWIWRYAEF